MKTKHLVVALMTACSCMAATAQITVGGLTLPAEITDRAPALADTNPTQDSIAEPEVSVSDSLLMAWHGPEPVKALPLPRTFFMPVVYNSYQFLDPIEVTTPSTSGVSQMEWVDLAMDLSNRISGMQQRMLIAQPGITPYNIRTLPEAPKKFTAIVNPQEHTIEIREIVTETPTETTLRAAEIKRRHWMRAFNASLQFSQAYVSPNWYQGGNNNLNALGLLYYNVKLNQEYHPNLLFETTAQYKLGITNAPDDKLHSYSISEDLFQVNSTFGVRAAKRWYYSLTGQFKTQLLNSYTINTTNLRSAFLSPADLTVGVGMTYNYANAKKSFTFDASIAPLSYNMRLCMSDRIDPANYGIDPGKHAVHKFGSSAEFKMMWKVSYNITLNSRVFAFTDYDRFYADWENTIAFEINRFLTTQIYLNARYDTKTPRIEGTKWNRFQLKEILSIGFAYKYSTL